MTTLVVFKADVAIPAGNRFGLLSGKRSRWQHVRFRHSVYLKNKAPDADASGAVGVCMCGGLSVTGLHLIQPQGFAAPYNFHIQGIIFRATHKTGLHIALTVTTIVRNIDTGLAD